MKRETKLVHVNTWEEFRRLAKVLRPSSVAYSIQRSPLSKPPVGLRIVFATEDAQYVFLDFARGKILQRTKISVRFNESGEAYVSEEEIKKFIQSQLERKDLPVYSFEILGY